MQIAIPSPQQIYDLSKQQLVKLKISLQINIQNKIKLNHKNKNNQQNQKYNDELQSLKQLLQNIQLELQQRKTIQYFTQLCINDGTMNKYVKEITDFNDQFKKLAYEVINNNQKEDGAQREGKGFGKQEDEFNMEKNKDIRNHTNFSSKQSQNSAFDRQASRQSVQNQDEVKSNQTMQTKSSQFTPSMGSQKTKKDPSNKTKTMGLGHSSMKKSKNSMQQFIKSTLSKSKAVQYVSTKGGLLKKSPQKVIKNGYHQRIQQQISNVPRSTGKIQKQSQNSQRTAHSGLGSSKSINQSTNRQAIIKKRNDAIQKMKNMKTQIKSPTQNPAKNSLPPKSNKKSNVKGLDPKSLVEMVKQQQQMKKKRQNKELVSETKIQTGRETSQIKQNILNKSQEGSSQSQKIQKQIEEHKSLTNKNQLNQNETIKPTITQKPQQKKSTTIQPLKQQKKQQEQNQTVIKQQINPIYSQSDTQSDNDTNKNGLIKKNQQRKSSQLKDNLNNPSIPQQQIQESITPGMTLPKVQKKLQASKTSLEPNVSQKAIKNHLSQNNLINNVEKTNKPKDNSVAVKQNFGKITEEYYNINQQSDNDKVNQQNNHQRARIEQELEQKQTQRNLNQQKENQVRKISSSPINSQENLVISSSKNASSKKLNKKQDPTNTKSKKDTIPRDELVKLPTTQQLSSTKIYNEQYWLHIKEQAQAKIQRFKQQKQIQRKQRQLKDKIIQQEKKKIKNQLNKQMGKKQGQIQQTIVGNKKQQQASTKQSTKTIQLTDDDNDVFIKKQKENFRKIYDAVNVDGSNKKMTKKPANAALVKQPKVVYPKPQFNYLEIFPSFNHIFNVFYTKAQGQAILDIPLVMKQVIQMFQTHIDYQKSHVNNFRPAIFLPFDNRNSKMNSFNDARSLLKNAQSTYINLKTLVQRLQIFNSNIQGEFQNQSQEQISKTQFYRVVKTKQEVYDIITTSFLRRKGWKELPHGQNLKANWNLFWSWSKPQIDTNKLLAFQRINHYPFNKNLSRKDLLYKNIDSFRKIHKVSFPFLPLTFNLPKQFTQFSKRFHQEQLVNRDKNYWIMKPIGKSRGRGIKLINSLNDLNYLDNIVVQKYISNPLLLDGYKFDMRIYVLVTSFHPLEAFVYREGFARLSTEKYSLEPGDMKNNFVHLTNFAINRHNISSDEQFQGGSKISIKALKQKITKMGFSFTNVWNQVHEIIIKSLLACSVSVPPFPAAFELFGYDIMMDQNSQCHLIQVNASPSLERSYLIDEIIKQSLIDDVIQIVNPPAFSKEQVIKVFNERLAPDFRNKKGYQPKKQQIEQQDLIHLARIMRYKSMRKYGQLPEKIGLFEMVAPSSMSKQLQKLIKSKSGINAPHNID